MVDIAPRRTAAESRAEFLEGLRLGLAIYQLEGESALHLFGWDAQWNVVTDTWHATLEEALHQAEFEYEGVSTTWNVA